MEEREQQRLNEEDEKRGEETRWRIPIPIQNIIYGKQVGVKRAAKGEKFGKTEDKQSWEDIKMKAMEEQDEIQKKLQPLFEEEARKMRDHREQRTRPKTRRTEAQKIIRRVISSRYAYLKKRGKGERRRLEMESEEEGGEKVKWPIPRHWLPQITAEERRTRAREYYRRSKMRENVEKLVAELEKWREMEGKQPTASPSQLPTTEVPPS